jgi:hypothetical protein
LYTRVTYLINIRVGGVGSLLITRCHKQKKNTKTKIIT